MHLASVFSRFFRKNLIFLFYFLLLASRLKFCAERTISGSPFRWKTGATLSGCPKKAPVIQNPLPKGEGWETNLSVCFADSSPNRGATGETVLAVLDEQSSSFPETAGLRCRDSRLLAQHPLLERSPAATANEDRARCFASHRAQANSRAGPACQGLPYQGSWREAPERLYQGTPSSKNRLLSQARLRGCTPCRFTIPGRHPFVQPLRHLR